MTSSFGTIIGTPRDKLPDISSTNYDRTEADLTETINDQIDANIADTKIFFDGMMEIAELRYKNRDDNLSQLANFAASAAEFKRVYDLGEEGRKQRAKYDKRNEKILEGLDTKDAKLEKAEAELEGEQAVAEGELLTDGSQKAIDVLQVLNKPDTDDTGIDKFRGNENFGAIFDHLTKNNFYDIGTSAEATNKVDEAQDLYLTQLYRKAQDEDINVRGRKWQRYLREEIFPKLDELKTNTLNEWGTVTKNKVIEASNKRLKTNILSTINSYVAPTISPEGVLTSAGNMPNMDSLVTNIANARRIPKKEAFGYMVDVISNELYNKTGKITPQAAENFRDVIMFSKNGTETKVPFKNLELGTNGGYTASLLGQLDKAIQYAIEDPDVTYKAKRKAFIATEMEPYYEKYIRKGLPIPAGEVLNIQAKWTKAFPNGEPMDQSILSANSQLSTGNSFGTSYYGGFQQVGQGDPTLEFSGPLKAKVLEKVLKDDATSTATLKNLGPDGNRMFNLALADLKERSSSGYKFGSQNFTKDDALKKEYPLVLEKLAAGEYDYKEPYFVTTERDTLNDKDFFTSNKGSIDQAVFASLNEKANIEESFKKMQDGNIAGAVTNYWKNLGRKLNMTGAELLKRRLKAFNLLDKKTEMLLPDNLQKMSEADKTQLIRNTNAFNSIDVFYKKDVNGKQPNIAIMLEGAKVTDDEKAYSTTRNGGIFSRRGDLTLKDLLNIKATSIGLYGISHKDLKKAVEWKPCKTCKGIFDGEMDKTFNEDLQSTVMAVLWTIQAQENNGTRGVAIDDVYPWRTGDFTLEETKAFDIIFPALENAPWAAKPQFLMKDVFESVISEREAKQTQAFNNAIAPEVVQEFVKANNLDSSITDLGSLQSKNISMFKKILRENKLKSIKTDYGIDFTIIPPLKKKSRR